MLKRILTYLSLCFYYRFIVIPTKEKAIKKGLSFETNIWGDSINTFNCRSYWSDQYGFIYRCAELETKEFNL